VDRHRGREDGDEPHEADQEPSGSPTDLRSEVDHQHRGHHRDRRRQDDSSNVEVADGQEPRTEQPAEDERCGGHDGQTLPGGFGAGVAEPHTDGDEAGGTEDGAECVEPAEHHSRMSG
jgi:hypothetical protein